MRRIALPAWLRLLAVMPLVLSACTGTTLPSPTAAPAAKQATAAPAGQAQPTAAAAKPAASGEKVELRFAWWGSQDRHDRTIKAIQLFQQRNPNITITYEFAGFTDYFTKMLTQATGNNLPDLMQQDYATITQWNANKLLVPLDEYVSSGAINLSDVPKNSIDGGRIDGKLIAINLGNNSQTVALDVQAFEKAGVPLPPQNWSWDDFEQTAMQLHQKLGIWGVGSGLSDIQLWKSLYLGHGQWAFTPDGKGLGYTDDQKYIDYLKMVQRLQDAGASPSQQEEISQFRTASVESTPIVPGKAAMQYFWSNQLVAAWTAAGADRKFQLTHLPRPKGGQAENYLKPSQFISITSHSKHPKEAAMFIDFITNDVEANKILLGERGVPISPKIQEAIKPLLTPAQTETLNYLSRIEKDNSPLPPPDPAAQSKLNDSIFLPQLVDAVLLKQITPEAAVTQFRKDASALLAS
jgi:multiple sugar transport system substrate-binding protein